MLFKEIPGHASLKKQLIKTHKLNKVAHAHLFAGNEGNTSLPLAMAYCTYLFCKQPLEHDSCGKCSNCHKIAKLVHPDIIFCFPKVTATESTYQQKLSQAMSLFRLFFLKNPFEGVDAWAKLYGNEKKLHLSKEDIRYMIRMVNLHPVEGDIKVFIIWYPETMTGIAANALLKSLEEPPKNVIYMLVTYNREILPLTITSRTQLHMIPPLSNEDLINYLVENKHLDTMKAQQVCNLAEGSIEKAIKLLDQENTDISYTQFQSWMRACHTKDFQSLVNDSETFDKKGKATQKTELINALSLIRQALLQLSAYAINAQNKEEISFITNFAKNLGIEKLEILYTYLNDTLIHLDRNANSRLSYLNLSLNIVRLLHK